MRLTQNFFLGDASEIAANLLGNIICRKDNSHVLKAYIVETEAYIGIEDSACHASKGKTARTSVMYGDAGRAYIYFVYGMHYMFNIVVGERDFPAAILVRAVEPIQGLEKMTKNRGGVSRNLTNGPAKFCQAFAIDKKLNNTNLSVSKELWIEEGIKINKKDIARTPRIGIDYAEKKDREKLWRFYIKGNKNVSR